MDGRGVKFLLEEIIVNKMINVNGKQYFVLSAYVVNTQILLDVLAGLNHDRFNGSGFKIPRTYEEDLLERIKNRQNIQHSCYELIVNGRKCRMVGRYGSQSDGVTPGKEFLNILIPEEFKGKPLELLKYDFEPMEGKETVRQLILRKKADTGYFLVRQRHTVPFGLDEDFKFRYTDPATLEDRYLYIRKFFAEQIEEDRRNLYGVGENESLLYAEVELDENISEFDLLTAGRLEGGINYTKAPMMFIEPLKDVRRTGYRGLRMPVGYISPEQEKIELVLFSIAKRQENQEDFLLYERNVF